MRLPDFYIIGAAKAGTTTLYQYLLRHPDIYMPDPKEPEFFARDEHYARGIDWYAQLFRGAEPTQCCGEASTIYTRYPQFPRAAERIAEHTPGAKLIYLVREPVERAYSHYVQEIKTAQNLARPWSDKETFEKALSTSSVYVDSSDYRTQIEQYLCLFRRQQLLVLLFEDLIEKPSAVLPRVVEFLGVDPKVELLDEGEVAANRASAHFDRQTRNALTQRFGAMAPGRLARALAPRWLREVMWRVILGSAWGRSARAAEMPPPMRDETRDQLAHEFSAGYENLEELLGLSLDRWRGH